MPRGPCMQVRDASRRPHDGLTLAPTQQAPPARTPRATNSYCPLRAHAPRPTHPHTPFPIPTPFGPALHGRVRGIWRCASRALRNCRRITARKLREVLHADAVGKVAKRLRRLRALRLPRGEERLDGRLEVCELHLVGEHRRDPRANWRAAHPYLILVRPLPHQCQFRGIWPRAAVGAARDARGERGRLGQPHRARHIAQPPVDVGHHALRLGLRQAAERQGRAGHRMAHKHVHLLDGRNAVLAQDRLDTRPLLVGHVLVEHRLRGGEHERQPELRRDLAERRLEPYAIRVNDPPLLHVDAHKPLAVALRVPAEPVDALDPRRQRQHGRERRAHVAADELAELVDAQRVHEVLHPRVGAHLAVAVVALRGEDGLPQLERVARGHEAERLGDARKGARLVVRAAHTATYVRVEPLERLAVRLEQHDEPQVVGEHVDRVVAGHGHANLELARQVRRAVQRLVRVARHDAAPRVVRAHRVNVSGRVHVVAQVVEVLVPVFR
mmetsp:Transcript_18303/g.57001  ORF Transcript_18303/g.57001 Transcript_18303/m.57001 type:complete len:498 (+) Transcript_18303:86-1579(+)